ncbi:MAG: hypothetical protein D6690_12200 [Nitrospirae bacterium]|nr:MAG: hypothetical protein D6690_12200 [Nitrospirota bacterium]
MRNMMTMVIAVLATALLIGNTTVNAAENLGGTFFNTVENLGSILRKSGWDRMIGTWVDAQTKGKMYKSVTAWRFKDQVLESSSEDFLQGKKDISLMIYNPKKSEVFHVSADDKGGSTLGRWTFTKEEAILDMTFVTPEKQEGQLQFRYKLIDDDTMVITVVLPEPIEIKMIRVKEKGKTKGSCPK